MGLFVRLADSNLAKKALSKAFQQCGEPQGFLFRAGQGGHYTTISLRQKIGRLQIR